MKTMRSFGFGAIVVAALASPALTDEQAFETPQSALDAFVAALAAQDGAAMLAIFGADAEDLLSTGSPDRDAANRAEILQLYQEGYRFRPGEEAVTLLLGAAGWPFPIPIARAGDGWRFDVETGREEVLDRRIGLNELEAIEILQVYVDIQAEYRLLDHDGDGVMEFAAGLLPSADGARDGLFWTDAESPMGARIALASLDGYSDGVEIFEPEPFGGYYFRVLTGQGAAAPGGAYSYMLGGNMVGGHALLAVPSSYGDTGIHSFMVSETGQVFEADLGEDTLDVVAEMTLFDPGDDWAELID